MRFPPPLEPGSRVALVAPSGPLGAPIELENAKENSRMMGWEPVVGAHASARDGYLAGSDADRAADLNAALRDDTIDGIWCIRGGYGAMRILDALDYASLAQKPKALIGYSDITALHAAVGLNAGLVAFHGPTARLPIPEFSKRWLRDAVAGTGDLCLSAPEATTLAGGRVTGPLAGGNLALLSALVGTPYAPALDGAILVLEDVNESVYRLDRMLTQLELAGAASRIAGLVFGQFTEIPNDASNAERPLTRLLEETAARWGVPCIANFPVGHVDEQFTLPLGAAATFDADARTIAIERRPA